MVGALVEAPSLYRPDGARNLEITAIAGADRGLIDEALGVVNLRKTRIDASANIRWHAPASGLGGGVD